MVISEKDKLAVIWGEEYPVLLRFLVSNDLVHMAEFFIPQGVKHQYINYSDQVVKAVKAVAPGL